MIGRHLCPTEDLWLGLDGAFDSFYVILVDHGWWLMIVEVMNMTSAFAIHTLTQKP